jgi:hypothetical protein
MTPFFPQWTEEIMYGTVKFTHNKATAHAANFSKAVTETRARRTVDKPRTMPSYDEKYFHHL